MADSPNLDEFLRHLQASLDEAETIDDRVEREERTLQLENAIQEALIFANRYKELLAHVIDPLILIQSEPGVEAPPPASKVQALSIGNSSCDNCGSGLDTDLDFCPACGAISKNE